MGRGETRPLPGKRDVGKRNTGSQQARNQDMGSDGDRSESKPDRPAVQDQVRAGGVDWGGLAEQVITGEGLRADQALSVLHAGEDELLALLDAAYRVRRHWFGRRVHLNFLINAKCGFCSEDCAYCSQSGVSKAHITRYVLVDDEQMLDGARLAARYGARTYCVAISGRSLGEPEFQMLQRVVPQIKARWGLRFCVSPGLLDEQQARRLKAAGVDRVNHNLNTSRRFYTRICTTHSYDDRLATLHAVRAAGLELCSGVIVGMGEAEEDVVEMALALADLRPEALPVNFLLPIPGTPLEGVRRLDPRYCLKVLALFRLACPQSQLRIAAGREEHLGPLQAFGLFAANSIFVGDYLTTRGQAPTEDLRMIEALGFEVESSEHDAAGPQSAALQSAVFEPAEAPPTLPEATLHEPAGPEPTSADRTQAPETTHSTETYVPDETEDG